jgi:ribosomal protein S18 acetylase RimI-like enzyme
MADVEVGHARFEDTKVLVDMIRTHVRGFYGRPEPSDEKVLALLGSLLFQKEGVVFLARSEGKVAGFAILYFTYSTGHADKIAVLNDVYVVDEMRGAGAGGALFDACRRYAKGNGFAYLTWQVARDNEKAQGFFERMGATREDWVTYSIS